MRLNRRHKRARVQKRYLERRLYKTERHIEKLNIDVLSLREAIKLIEHQEIKKRTDREAALNKALHDTAVESVPAGKGETRNAGNT